MELAQVARLADGEEDQAGVLQRIVFHARSLVPGCSAAGLTVRPPEGGLDVAVTDDQVARCHDAQFHPAGEGPARETLRSGQPHRVDDVDADERWPGFVQVARDCGFASCLALPLGVDQNAATALNLYADRRRVFIDTTFDVALLFAAQGGVALDNAERYRQARQLIEHLHRTLVTRSMIERAKGFLMGQHGLGAEEAFDLLRRRSQDTHRKLRDVAADLLRQADPQGSPEALAWTPPRAASAPRPEPGAN